MILSLLRLAPKPFRRDLPKAEIRFFDTDHFALETHAGEIGAAIRQFLISHVG